MKRTFHTDRLHSDRLDDLLSRLGFIYGITQDGENRYRLADFMKEVGAAKVFLSERGDEAILCIRLPQKD